MAKSPFEDNPSTTNTAALIAAVERLSGHEVVTITHPTNGVDVPVLILPEGKRAHTVEDLLRDFMPRPDRRTGTATLSDLDSFVAHVARFRSDHSAIFAQRDMKAPGMVAVYDYHPAGPNQFEAAFGEHRAAYRFPLSEAWQAWAKVEAEGALPQAKFAAWIEDRIMDVLPPPTDGRAEVGALALDLVTTLGGTIAGPSTLLEIARGLRVHEQSEVVNALNLSSGETEVVFRTEHRDAQGKPLRVPNLFLVQMPVFDGDAAYRLPVRLQYRRADGRILWSIRRYRPELVFTDAFDRALEKVRTGTGAPVFLGTPEAP